MAATREDIQRWLQTGIEKEATHVIVMCDTFDWDDYPVYVSANEDIHEKLKECRNKSMAKVMEVYNLKMDIEAQMREHRAYNL